MRLVDFFASLAGLILLTPLFIIVAIWIKVSSPGPIFYRAKRIGRGGNPFGLYKFRSMVVGADKQGPGITVAQDSRVTKIGTILRKYKLDELPQLINVLIGDMALVGPRPEDPRYVAKYTDEQKSLLQLRPGITSPASLQYRDESSLLQGENWEEIYITKVMPDKLAIELDYLQKRTLWHDLSLIFQTIWAIRK